MGNPQNRWGQMRYRAAFGGIVRAMVNMVSEKRQNQKIFKIYHMGISR